MIKNECFVFWVEMEDILIVVNILCVSKGICVVIIVGEIVGGGFVSDGRFEVSLFRSVI